MNLPSRLDSAALDAVLDALLMNNPTAPIVAIDAHGLFVPMPGSVPLTTQWVIQGHSSALELVLPNEALVVIEAWTQARRSGAGRAAVHLESDPGASVAINYVDAMHRHGVFIGIFEADRGHNLMTAFGDTPTLRPKVALVQKDEMAFIRHVDEATCEILGWAPDEMVGRRSLDFIDPEDHGRAIANWMDMLRTPGSRRRARLRHRHSDGSWVWFEITNYNLLNDAAHRYVLTEMVDISDEMAAQEALRAREHLLGRLTETLPLGICQVDASGHIVYRNARLASILGNRSAPTIQRQLASVLPGHRRELKQALDAVLGEGGDQDLEVGLRQRSGDGARRCTLSLRALKDESGAGTGAIVCVTDVTDSVRMREELNDRATFDALTRCYNRATVLQLLEQILAEQTGGGSGTGAIFVDLDHFKEINDRLGHAAGDVLLVEAVRRLRRAVRPGDIIGRLGGDEFLVVCARIETPSKALRIAERMADAISEDDVQVGAEMVRPSVSIGLAWSDRPGTDADTLVARADLAMYESKRQRQGRPVQFGDPSGVVGQSLVVRQFG